MAPDCFLFFQPTLPTQAGIRAKKKPEVRTSQLFQLPIIHKTKILAVMCGNGVPIRALADAANFMAASGPC